MFAVSYQHTMSNAKFAPPKAESEAVDLVQERKRWTRERAIAEAAQSAAARERIRQDRLLANELVARGRATALRLRMAEGGIYRASYYDIEVRVCRALKVRRDELYSDRRHRKVVLARHAIMYWACRLTLMSLPEIGRKMGGKDHTTVLHARNTYPDKRAKQGRFLRAVR